MMRKSLWLGGSCLLALGLMGMAAGGPTNDAAVVSSREAQTIWGGQYCPVSIQITNNNICKKGCPETLCIIKIDMGANYDVKNMNCEGTDCGAGYASCD